jgi:hypothetical protein
MPRAKRGGRLASALALQAQDFTLPDKGGDGEIPFPGKVLRHSRGYFAERGFFFALACPLRRREERGCHTPVEGGEKSVFEAMIFAEHCFPPGKKVGLRFLLNRDYHGR